MPALQLHFSAYIHRIDSYLPTLPTPYTMLQLGRTRVRQHVNPLAIEFKAPLGPVDWSSIYSDVYRPLIVDLGCGPGRFLLLLHKRHQQQAQQFNYLGIEIRQPVGARYQEMTECLHADATSQ